MVRDEDIFPIGSIVRLKKSGEFAKITKYNWLRPEKQKHFLNYFADIEGRKPIGPYAVYHDDCDLEALPKKQ